MMCCCFNQENTSSKKAKADVREGDEAEGSNKSKSEVEDDEQDGNEVYTTHAS
jgi:high mobility group protein B3